MLIVLYVFADSVMSLVTVTFKLVMVCQCSVVDNSFASIVLYRGSYVHFWATVCKTIHPMLSDRCLSCLSVLSCPVLSVTLVYCGQMVGRIKMKHGLRVGLGPVHIVLDGNPGPPPQRGTAKAFPSFLPIPDVAKWLHESRCHLVWR